MFGGGSRWPFFQLALVLTGFQIAFIGLAIGTHNWGVQPPEILVKMNPLWSKFGQNNVLVPASLFDRMQQASTWRIGVNMMVWAAFQFLGGGLLVDWLRSLSR